jgi:energy-coupling factor transporter ATP-binding protein EcfA2
VRRNTVLIVGHGGHGKDTACQILAGLCPLKNAGATSEGIYPFAAAKSGIPEAVLRAERAIYREMLAEFGDMLRKDDPARLVKDRFAIGGIANGVRRLEELNECIRLGLATHYLWVESDKIGPDSTLTFGWNDLPKGYRFRIQNTHGNLAIMVHDLASIARGIAA